MARTVADAALMLSVIAGGDARAPLSYPVESRAFARAVSRPEVRGVRIAWGEGLGVTPVDAEVLATVHGAFGAFRRLGARVGDAHPDFGDLAEIVRVSRGLSMVGNHEEKLPKWRGVMQENLVKNIDYGLTLTASDIGRAERQRTLLYQRAREFFERWDLIVTPTTAVPPFPIEEIYPKEINGVRMADYIQWALPTYAFTVIGVPAISVPCGFTKAGLPVGLQIAGRWRDEATVLRAAAAFERAHPWADRRPPE
jgi:amidase